MLLLSNHPEISLFFQNIRKINERIERLLERREEKELCHYLNEFAESAFNNLNAFTATDKLDIYEETLIKEIALVNKIISKFRFEIQFVFTAVKTTVNSLKEFSEGALHKAITLIDELLDLLKFLYDKFWRKNAR